jgi:hypothetical protein
LKFAVTIESDTEAEMNIRHVNDFTQELSEVVKSWDYGDGLQNFYIGFVCIKTRPGYKDWYKERKPRFKKVSKTTRLDGTAIEFQNVFSYDLKLSDEEFDSFCTASSNDAVRLFANRMIESFDKLEHLRKRAKPLELDSFRNDLSALVTRNLVALTNA